MHSKVRVLALAGSLVAALVATPAFAQDPSEPASTPSPVCGLLTAAEIEAALAEALPVTTSDDSSCTWDSYESGGSMSLGVSFTSGNLEDLAAAYTDATSAEIGGAPALIGSDGTFLFIEANGGILSVFAFAFGVDELDVPAAVRSLAESALGRLGSIELPPEPTPFPQPSFLGDAELGDRFPDSVGGAPLEVTTATAAELFGIADPYDAESQAQLQAIKDALATQGKTLDDMTIGFSYFTTADGSGGISAIRVRGAQISSLLDGLLPLLMSQASDLQVTPATIAGKTVQVLTDGPDGPYTPRQYAYPDGDVLWVLQTDEPMLSELLGQLP